MRTPLTVIKTSVEVIQTHPERIHPADGNKLENILSATQQMTRLVEDLLLLARTDTALKNSSKPWIAISLVELIEDTIDLFEIQAREKDLAIKLRCDNDVLVEGAPCQLHRVFANLLDNAIKYTPNHGKIIFQIKQLDKFAAITIEDTGIGIASEHLPLIFHRFWREENARFHQEGTGLGLAIVKAIVRHHGGDITVSSKLGIGTSFKVRLPI